MFDLFKSILTKVGLVHADAPAQPAAAEAAPAPVVAEPVPVATGEEPDEDALPEEVTDDTVPETDGEEEAASDDSEEADTEEADAEEADTEEADAEEAAAEQAVDEPEPVDVVALLDGKVAASHEKGLDWRHSIVDLLKLLELDSSLHARQGLAEELGYTGSTAASHSADMNVWLIKEVLKRLTENGGNIPKELTH